MTRKLVRIKVKCEACRTGFVLSQAQYQFLLKRSQLSLQCPHCGHHFVYRATTVRSKANSAEFAPPRPAEVEASAGIAMLPLEPIVPAQPAVPDFPPPPFAPLAVGTAAPEMAAQPPFVSLGAAPASPPPAASSRAEPAASDGNNAKKLTLNERFKRLPAWQQWLVIGVAVVLIAIVMFSMPRADSGDGTPGAGAAQESKTRPAKSSSEGPAENKQTPEKHEP